MIQAGTYVVDDTTLYHIPLTTLDAPFMNFVENYPEPKSSLYEWRMVTNFKEINAVQQAVDFYLRDGEYAVFGPPANPQLLFEGR